MSDEQRVTAEPVDAAARMNAAADRIDAEDVPQTVEDTADFVDGVRWATAQLRSIASDTPPGLTKDERTMLRYALELVQDRIHSEGDEFTDDDRAAVDSLKRLATGPTVAYRNPWRPGVLLCREHGDGWNGLEPLAAEDLPNGGTCTYGDPANPDDVCGRDVMAPKEDGAKS